MTNSNTYPLKATIVDNARTIKWIARIGFVMCLVIGSI